ncbi:unnamed protein product [Gordionus sp. m RMFG-2023]
MLEEDVQNTNSIQVYSKLFVQYLLSDDLLLIKRLPNDIKSNKDLQQLTLISNKLWNQDYDNVLRLYEHNWQMIADDVDLLRNHTQSIILDILTKCYFNMKIQTLTQLLNQSNDEVLKLIKRENWHYNPKLGIVYINERIPKSLPMMKLDDSNLKNLINSISFFEN